MSAAAWVRPYSTGLPPLERTEQKRIVALYRSAGCKVWIMSQHRPRGSTKQSKGLPDMLVKHPAKKLSWTHETKTEDGRVSKEQHEFADACRACGDCHLVGGYQVAWDFLKAAGMLA